MGASYADIAERIAAIGLLPRGGFHPEAGDAVPMLPDGRPTRALILIGNAGPQMWARFRPFLDAHPHLAHPLNTWVMRAVQPLASQLGAHAVFPHEGPPFHSFVRWAQRAEPVHPAPIGLLIHPRYGLWHAYRAALLFAEDLAVPDNLAQTAPCETCTARPCLHAGPGDPRGPSSFDAARRACPVGREFTYGDEQSAFHQRAFRRTGGAN